jgi:hypothetical protein
MYTGLKNLSKSWKLALVLAALGAWASVPFLSRVEAGGVPILVRTANLVSPTGSVNPHGDAEWELYANGNRELETEIEDVNLPAGTSLTAIVDGSSVGQIILEADRRGRLKLRTEDGQSVPNINDGSTVQVLNGNTVLVSGVFGGGGPTPTPSVSPTGSPTGTPTGTPTASPSPSVSPSPTGSPNNEVQFFAALTGPTLNGALPRGYAQFEVHSSRTELEIRVRGVNLPIGTPLSVVVDSNAVGTLIIASAGEGELRLRSDRGQNVPNVTAGSTIQINNGSSTVLSGTFAGMTGPTPTPSPTGSPTPGQGRSFESHLLGSGVTPPVATNATGEIKITLSADETLATVFGEFHDLSSNQTGARLETTAGTVATFLDLGVVGGQNGNFASRTVAITAAQVVQLRTGLMSAVITSVNNPNGEIRGTFVQQGGSDDFDGDGGSDLALFRPSEGVWYSQNASGFSAVQFGDASDIVVSADYDGDGKTDTAVFKNINGSGVWDIKRSSDGGITTFQFGVATDIPVRGDFDGDGRSDYAVFRPSEGVWYVQKSDNTGYIIVRFGLAGDKPIAMDMDGDGRDDIAVFRPSDGTWWWLRSSDGGTGVVQFGATGDIPVCGDFDGDGKTDPTVYRPSTGVWYILRTTDWGYQAARWGVSTDIPVPGNFDNDGLTDIAVFRPSTGQWWILRSSDLGFEIGYFGLAGDIPVAAR